MKQIVNTDAATLSNKIYELLKGNSKLRNEIISIGIPILLPDGKSLLRGNDIKIPPFRGDNELDINEHSTEIWAHDGWVDLSEKNMKAWKERIQAIISEAENISLTDTSSMHVRTKKYWNNFEIIDIGKVVGWIFITEEKGERMKA
jgi:sulfur relay (sulfurtransferase) DsrC/TusE family protein